MAVHLVEVLYNMSPQSSHTSNASGSSSQPSIQGDQKNPDVVKKGG